MAPTGLVLALGDHVHGGLLGRRAGTVDADVEGERVALAVPVGTLVRGDQPARALGTDLTVVDVLDDLGVGVGLGLLLRDALVEGLALALLGGGVAEALARRPRLR